MPRISVPLHVILLATTATACGEPLAPGGNAPPEPVAIPMRMEAIIDGQRVVASVESGFELALIDVNKGGIQVSATFRGSAGDPQSPATSSPNVRLDVVGSATGAALPQGVEFTRYDAFSGGIYRIGPGQTVSLWLGLYHVAQERYIFGPFSISVRRRAIEDDTSL